MMNQAQCELLAQKHIANEQARQEVIHYLFTKQTVKSEEVLKHASLICREYDFAMHLVSRGN